MPPFAFGQRAGTAEQKPPTTSHLHFFPHEILMLPSLKKKKRKISIQSWEPCHSNRLCGIFGNCSRSPPSSGRKGHRKEQQEEAQKSLQNGKNTKDREEDSGAVCVHATLQFTLWEEWEQRTHGLWLSDSLWEEPRGLVSILRQSGGLRRTHVSHTQLQAAPPPWLLPHPQRLPGPSSLGSPVADSPHTGPNYERFRYERPSLQ